jgi:hypothetical protein
VAEEVEEEEVITPEEAKQLAHDARLRELELIEADISEAAKNGHMSCELHEDHMSNNMAQELRDVGYRVNYRERWHGLKPGVWEIAWGHLTARERADREHAIGMMMY